LGGPGGVLLWVQIITTCASVNEFQLAPKLLSSRIKTPIRETENKLKKTKFVLAFYNSILASLNANTVITAQVLMSKRLSSNPAKTAPAQSESYYSGQVAI
jgi:hypothetical protein